LTRGNSSKLSKINGEVVATLKHGFESGGRPKRVSLVPVPLWGIRDIVGAGCYPTGETCFLLVPRAFLPVSWADKFSCHVLMLTPHLDRVALALSFRRIRSYQMEAEISPAATFAVARRRPSMRQVLSPTSQCSPHGFRFESRSGIADIIPTPRFIDAPSVGCV
jgi:hypothetical protein